MQDTFQKSKIYLIRKCQLYPSTLRDDTIHDVKGSKWAGFESIEDYLTVAYHRMNRWAKETQHTRSQRKAEILPCW